ncbi:unnamed protein product [Peronospora belbahrii]|uniref:Uncharacterized protein n=1 Tax=Peronospora belbahrii TaxID=622444 RepID=A0ABN8CQF2_9STRA|nr:unnamed protein product [Peronospora belbahrii]
MSNKRCYARLQTRGFLQDSETHSQAIGLHKQRSFQRQSAIGKAILSVCAYVGSDTFANVVLPQVRLLQHCLVELLVDRKKRKRVYELK